ncbi:MAG: hypothetical protein EXR72_19655 [Myxococcales bacterium]|nr:hypothetical protein [Myxococcales bacterium]
MDNSVALAADPSRQASLLLRQIQRVFSVVAPRHPGASAAIIDRVVPSRALRSRQMRTFCCWLILAASTGANAEGPPPEKEESRGVVYDRGIVIQAGGVRLRLNGLLQARFVGASESVRTTGQPPGIPAGHAGFDLHHAQLALVGEVAPWVGATLVVDLGSLHAPTAPFAVRGGPLRDAFIEVRPLPWLALRAGQLAVPFGRQRAGGHTSEGSFTAAERNLATLAFTVDRDLGALVVLQPWSDRILLQMSLTDGVNAGAPGARNDNLDLRYVARLTLSPLGQVPPFDAPGITVAGAVLYDLVPTNDPVNADRDMNGRIDNVSVLSANGELAAAWWRVSVQAEYFWRRETYGPLAPTRERRYQGFSAQLQGLIVERYLLAEAHVAFAEPHTLGTQVAAGATPPGPFAPPPSQNASLLDTFVPTSAWQFGGSLMAFYRSHDLKLQATWDYHHRTTSFAPGCVAGGPCELTGHVVQVQTSVGF